MAQKTILSASSLCLPIVLLIFPLPFNRPSMSAELSFASAWPFEAFSASACSDRTREIETGPLAASEGRSAAAEGCVDPIDKCKKPIKYLGSKGDCACFACEYGKATQHNICTQNKKDKETLLAESEPE